MRADRGTMKTMPHSEEHAPRLVGRYVLYGELASGGMATVHFGRLSGPVGFSRTVAIKRLHPHYAKDPEFVTMFLDEARLCGRIRHPNVVPTLDVVTMDGEIFIVMEYVAGEALSKLLKVAVARGMPMPPRVAAAILSSVLHGLHAAHQTKDEHGRDLGIVHRDVSPQNILVGSDGVARVLDFGVAKAAGRMQTTRDGQLKGKIAYMPPEQLGGAAVTRQVDVYAAAVVLWEALCGRRLFDGETETMVLARAIEGKVEPPSVHNPTLDAATDAVILRALARDPAARYATAREMAIALEQTMGLASPSEVGEWVDSVAEGELSRRAATIAAIEAASVSLGADVPAIGLGRAVAPDMPSQVSSISVARAAVSSVAPRRRSVAKTVATVFGALALVGIVLGAVAMREILAGTKAAGTPRVVEASRRPLQVLHPEAAAKLARSASPAAPGNAAGNAAGNTPGNARPSIPRWTPPPPPAAKPQCDPPFTIDPENGRKVYKRECLK